MEEKKNGHVKAKIGDSGYIEDIKIHEINYMEIWFCSLFRSWKLQKVMK
jgi:hypothetical protein